MFRVTLLQAHSFKCPESLSEVGKLCGKDAVQTCMHVVSLSQTWLVDGGQLGSAPGVNMGQQGHMRL